MRMREVVGHDAAKRQLAQASARGRLAQAYLLAGPHGVGKRTFATALAQVLLCESPPADFESCGTCPACKQVAAETHPQFHALRTPADKSDLPVDAVRAFTAKLYQTPSRVPRTVGYVHDADDLNLNSANSLLKTLEEPPAGCVILLRTSDAERQLPTIRSRCQTLAFGPLSDADVAKVLVQSGTDSAEAERLAPLAGGLPGVAGELAAGSLGDFRATFLRHLARPDAVALALEWVALCEEAGKEPRDQRARGSASLRVALDALRAVHRAAADPDPATGDAASAAERGGAAVGDWIDACTEADYLLDRNVQVALVFEQLAARLARGAG